MMNNFQVYIHVSLNKLGQHCYNLTHVGISSKAYGKFARISCPRALRTVG